MYNVIKLLLLSSLAEVWCWRYGRATFYGNEPWYWPIHKNSCGFGYLCKDEGTGWDVAALSDQHGDYPSCGQCYEVKCNPTYFQDGYGATIDRSQHCIDSEASVVITVVDKCPCTYANNAYSNRRWCCGDMDHFDMSVWAFEKLAEMKWGVIGIQYRKVACDYQPYKKAQIPPQGEHWGEEPAAYGATCPQNNFPRYAEQTVQQPAVVGEEVVAVPTTATTPAPAPAPATTQSAVKVVYGDNGEGEFELQSWSADVWEINGEGVKGGVAVCGQVFPGGAISLKGSQGSFKDQMMLEFWTSVNGGQTANAAVNIQGANKGCAPLLFNDLSQAEVADGLAKFEVTLSQFVEGDSSASAVPSVFTGCGYMDVSEIQRVSFHNYEYTTQYFCVDEVALKK